MKSRPEVPLVTAWSASRVFEYELCPAKLYFSHTQPRREPEPGSPLAEGKRIHAEGEAFLRGKTKVVPTFYRYFEKDLRALKRAKAESEVQLAFTADWELTDWFARDVWCRMALDALVLRKRTARVVDFKTGRIYAKDEEQLELYALGLFHAFPGVQKVEAELWYLKSDEQITLTITRAEQPQIQKSWEQRASRVLEAREFPPKPGPPGRWPCKHCDFSRDKGGPCRAG